MSNKMLDHIGRSFNPSQVYRYVVPEGPKPIEVVQESEHNTILVLF
jgi:hypothetical protein